jgi:hypothetical protein
VTNCKDTSCTALGNPTGAPTGGPDPTDIVAVKVDQHDGDDQGQDDGGDR